MGRRSYRLILARAIGIVAALCVTAVPAQERPLSLWQVMGEVNRVYLLGSVHLLRAEDYPLPAELDTAYANADELLMELDLDDLDPTATQALVSRLGHIQDDRQLADWLGADVYAHATRLAAAADIELSRFSGIEPWFAAITVEQIALSRIGFDPSRGIEAYMLEKATADGKRISGLETMEEQLGLLDGLPLADQRALLLQTLDEATAIESVMDGLIEAWRYGDVASLEQETLEEMRKFPKLYDALVVRRNRNWTDQIVELLDDRENYLVIVGTLHLVGDESVLAMLQSRGITSEQLRQGRAD